MTDPNDTPIVVNPDQTMGQLGVALRYALTTVGAFAIGKGWITDEFLQLLVAIATVVAPAAYAFYKAHQQKKTLVTIAASAPDSVAVVRP